MPLWPSSEIGDLRCTSRMCQSALHGGAATMAGAAASTVYVALPGAEDVGRGVEDARHRAARGFCDASIDGVGEPLCEGEVDCSEWMSICSAQHVGWR